MTQRIPQRNALANPPSNLSGASDARWSTAAKLQGTASSTSGIEDIDLAETILELNMQQVAYRGALGAAAKVLQPTLMEFLR